MSVVVQNEKKWDWMLKCIEQPIRRYKDGGSGLSRSDVVHQIEDFIKAYLKNHNTKFKKKIVKELSLCL